MQGTTPYININLSSIKYNAEIISKWCRKAGIDLWGVTKVTCGNPEIASIMLESGCVGLADSRIKNLEKLRNNFPTAKLLCIRPPGKNEFEKLIKIANVSLQTDTSSIKQINDIAIKMGKTHNIILLMELGDLREGIPEDEFISVVKKVLTFPGINLIGIGGVLTCLSGVIPTKENLNRLIKIKTKIEEKIGIKIPIVAGGASNFLPMLLNSELPKGINELHVGESILLGINVLTRKPFPELKTDTFELVAEVIECYKKPSKPQGKLTQNAMGETPYFEDNGMRKRAILNLGTQDTTPSLLTPLADGVLLLDASSDHMVVDVEDVGVVKTGDVLCFKPGYSALLHLMDSDYIQKRFSGGRNGT